MKTILLVFKADIFDLPPMITIIDSLKERYKLKVITHLFEGNEEKFREMYKDDNVELITSRPLSKSRSKVERLKNRLKRRLFEADVRKQFSGIEYDILWCIHEDTIMRFADLFKGKKYIVSLYELNDTRQYILKGIQETVQNAQAVYVPEYNRACITRCWLELKKTPTVIPNKPLDHPMERNLPCIHQEYFDGKFTILYQGLVIEERKIDAYCEAVQDMDDVQLVVMGNGYGAEEYRNSLKARFPKVKFIDFVTPPKHLNVTSNAQVGIVTYDYSTLNTIFCAPNKIWEYAGFGIPMIANDIPGLNDTVNKYHAGICVDTEDASAIKEAIVKISSDYELYKKSTLEFYNSCDIKTMINKIVEDYIKA